MEKKKFKLDFEVSIFSFNAIFNTRNKNYDFGIYILHICSNEFYRSLFAIAITNEYFILNIFFFQFLKRRF